MTPEIEVVQTLPVLPIKNTVLFPYLFLPLSVGRPASVAAVEAALATEEKTLLVVAQRDRRQRAARPRRSLHRRHPGRHQEDGPLRRRGHRAFRPGDRAAASS